MNNLSKIIAVVIVFSLSLCVGRFSFAYTSLDADDAIEKKLKIEYVSPINIKISSKGINRLNFGKDRLIKIVGDTNKFNAILSENGRDLFLTSKLPAKEIINLSLITASTDVIDLKCTVADILDPSIINVRSKANKINLNEYEDEIKSLIYAMHNHEPGKYYVKKVNKIIKLPLSKNEVNNRSSKEISKKRANFLKLKKNKTYQFEDLLGIEFDCFNLDKKHEIVISKELLTDYFQDLIAIAIIDKTLPPKSSTKIFGVLNCGAGK